MSGYAEKMHSILEYQAFRAEALRELDECLAEIGVVVEASDYESYVAGIGRVLEAYEVPEETERHLHEIIGTLAVGLGALGVGKWLHGKYKDWQYRRAQKKYAKAQRDYHGSVLKHHTRALKAKAAAVDSGQEPDDSDDARHYGYERHNDMLRGRRRGMGEYPSRGYHNRHPYDHDEDAGYSD